MTRRAALLSLALLASSCTSAQAAAFVPRVVVRAGTGRSVGSTAERWSWWVRADARWALDRPAAGVTPSRPREPEWAARGEVRCAAPSLCGWERRQAARATERALSTMRSER